MPRALISVSDKRGIVPFAEGLAALGWEIISTGGTAAALRTAGLAVTTVEDVTGFPELLDGRVKTLHPAVHAAVLARRDSPEHLAAIADHGIVAIDLVAVNLYPFQMTISQPGVSFADAVENIDVGGPSMLRSAAKNHEFVLPVVDPTDYTKVLEMLRRGGITPAARRDLAAKVFAHTAEYDAAIAGFLDFQGGRVAPAARRRHGTGADPSLRRESVPARRALRHAGAERHARPDPAAGKGAFLQQPPRCRCGHVGHGVLEQSAGLLRGQAHDAVRHRGGRLGRRGVSQGSRNRSGLRVRLRGRVQHRGGPGDRAGDERPLRRGRRGPVVSRRGTGHTSPPRRRCGWWSCP